MPPAIAIAGAAVIGAGASIISGNKASKAAKKAADLSIAEERRQYDQTRADFAPWRETGSAALGKLAGMYGVGATASGAGGGTTGGATASGTEPYGGFFTSPGYQFRLDEGNKAIERSAAARGLLRSGAAVKAIDRFTQDLASSEYSAFTERLAQLSGFGQSATGSTAAAGQAATAGITNAIGVAGNARASSYLNTGAAINNGLQGAVGAYLYGAGGGFGGGNAGSSNAGKSPYPSWVLN